MFFFTFETECKNTPIFLYDKKLRTCKCVNVLMCESINELAHLQINEFLYPYLAFRNANTIEV